jgi:acyl-CoA reductase-like NAD-dependent aldehyde dehydrogenase
MTKKSSPIAEHKEDDLKLGRKKLLQVINGVDPTTANATMVKNMTEAIKLLFRSHHALQVDKVVATAVAKQAQAQQLPPEDLEAVRTSVKELLERERERTTISA